MASVLVTGSSRGVGLKLVKRLASHPQHPDFVIATCRDPSKATKLTALCEKFPHVKVLQLDVDGVDKYEQCSSQVSSVVGEKCLKILINNAGVCREKVQYIEDLKYEFFFSTFKINLFGPVFLTKAFVPLLKRAASQKNKSAIEFKQVAILNVSSSVGSVALEKSLVYWGYAESKAALNQVTRGMASNFNSHGILAASLHPGWVRTDMGGPDAHLSLEESATGLMSIITNLSPDINDKFLDFTGKVIPW